MNKTGVIYGINGPVVYLKGNTGFKMSEMVYVGKERLVGEVIALTKDTTTVQVFEETTGLKPGETVTASGDALSVTLGPGILNNIFDGIERPLSEIAKQSGKYISRGLTVDSLDTEKKWDVHVTVSEGEELMGGAIIAETQETRSIVHKSMVPPDVNGTVIWAAKDGKYTILDPIVKLKLEDGTEKEITLAQKWPIRVPRPTLKRYPASVPLITGQRILDTMFPIAKGGTAAIPGGFGTGKTMTQHQIAKWSDADIIIYIGCGERGNEMTQVLEEFQELIDPKSGNPLMDRTTLIANTSNKKALKEVGETNAQIFEIHMMMLEDDDYNESIQNIIDTQKVNAEYAVSITADNFAEMFSAMDDAYMQARAADVRDISDRIIANLTGNVAVQEDSDEKRIICADDLAPSETVSLDKDKVLAFVTAHGSSNSHTAILARNMNIPAVIGVGSDFLKEVQDGTEAIVDGFTGEIFVEPDEETRQRLLEKQRADEEKKRLLLELKGKENITKDGTKVNIYANIGSVDNIGAVLLNDAGGIGLFRSEFLYLENTDYPNEEQQFLAYKRVLESMAGKKVIIRTLDIGADKQVDYFHLKKEDNPAMGYRAIRICLTRPEIFKTQLRALYRASIYGNLGVMFPMITSVSELEKILAICEEVKAELREQGVTYSDTMELGIMIETPAAAIISDRLAPMVDFFSVGTNDLTQYTLACDRQNPDIEPFIDTHHEAILRLIEMSAKNAHANGAWIGICGELAADTTLTETFLRMGIDELSVSPAFVLKVRDAVRNVDLRK